MCPVDGISVHTRQQQRQRRRHNSSKKEQLLAVHRRKESLPHDFSLIGHSALNMTSSLPTIEHTAQGRIQRGIVSQQQNGCHNKLPTIVPQLAVEGQRERRVHTASSHYSKVVLQPVRKLLQPQQQHTPVQMPPTNIVSSDPSINITGVPLVSR